jgi:cardiolipin synthase
MDEGASGEVIRLLRNGDEAFPAWLEALRSAQQEILLEMYWFADDRTGQRFKEVLVERARAGVDVCVIYDALGSLGSEGLFDELTAAGARVLEFHPIAPWRKRFRVDGIAQRDHRKIIVVDATIAFTGGINICDQAASRAEGGGGWRDDAVRVTGAAAVELRALFFDTWLRLGGAAPQRGAVVVRRARRQLLAAARVQAGGTIPPPSLMERIQRISRPSMIDRDSLVPAQDGKIRHPTPSVQVFGHAAWAASRTIRNLYVRHIRAAGRLILIANSYFVPDPTVRRALERAARRGVEVRVIVPGKSDVPSVSIAMRALYTRLMRAGVHIHEWVDGMMHAKTAVVDAWATVGSYNLDYRSLRHNLEANVASSDTTFVTSVETSVRSDLDHCREIDPVVWAKRPWLQKALEWLLYLIRKLL